MGEKGYNEKFSSFLLQLVDFMVVSGLNLNKRVGEGGGVQMIEVLAVFYHPKEVIAIMAEIFEIEIRLGRAPY